MSVFKKLRNMMYSVEGTFSSMFSHPSDKQFRLKSRRQFECSHDLNKFPEVIKDEKCLTCETHQCYICSENNHLPHNCKVELSKLIYPEVPFYNSTQNLVKLRAFNYGQVGRLNVNKVRCICGKSWGPGFTICAACGMASCSKSCHSHWERKGYCTLKNVFTQQYNQSNDMRSILYDNIQYAAQSKLQPGTQINTNKSKFLTCFTTDTPRQVFLQRGYRLYGHPNQSLVSQLQIIPINIDYYLHLDRICSCICIQCKDYYHSAGMCTSPCIAEKLFKLNQSLQQKKHQQICQCKCAHCLSGQITKGQSHSLTDCMFQCHNNIISSKQE